MTTYAHHRTPAKHPGEKTPASAWVLLGIGFLVLGGLTFGIAKFIQSRANRPTTTVAELKFTRDSLEPAAPIDASAIFDQKTLNRLNNGDGLTADFSETFRGNVEWSRKFEIETLHITGNTDYPRRRTDVRKKMAEFDDVVKEFGTYRPRTWTIEVYFDDTNGVTPADAGNVLMHVDDLSIQKMLDRGDSVDFYCYRLSDSFFVDEQHVNIGPKNSSKGVLDTLAWLMQPQAAKYHSSTFAGFFNTASQNNGKPNRTLLVFTDWLENSDFGDFYHKPPQPDDYPTILGRVTGTRQVPNLKGAEVLSWAPHDAADAKQIDLAQKFATAILRQAGAWQVKMVY